MRTKRILEVMVCFVFFAHFSLYAGTKAKHVILIGLDGWGSYSVEKADMPVVKKLMAEGAYTLKKRAVLPSSSAVNWASMFMGACPELHGYTEWGSRTPEIPSREVNRHGIFPTIFSLLREADPKAEIGCLYEWDGIKYLPDDRAAYRPCPNSWKQRNEAGRTVSVAKRQLYSFPLIQGCRL
jgi:hypothetical protein